MKNWLYIVLGIVIVTITALLLGFTARQQKKVICQKVEVRILNSRYNKFLENKDVLDIIDDHGIKTKGEPLESINTLLIERLLQHSPVVRSVAAYTIINGQLIIEVEQRMPIVRIIDRSLQQYFIDEEGVVLPDRIKQIAHVLVANGNIPPIAVKPGQKNSQNFHRQCAEKCGFAECLPRCCFYCSGRFLEGPGGTDIR